VPDEPSEPIVDEDGNVIDTSVDRAIDRLIGSAGGVMSGNAMLGFAKALGWHKEQEETVEIRESSPPDEDPDDPIEVRIDPDHPENTRIVYRMRPEGS
jgi:hypothetical protein